MEITLVPLGYTAIIALIIHGAAGYAGKQADLAGGPDLRRGIAVAKVTGVLTASYTVIVTTAAMLIEADGPAMRAVFGSAVLTAVIGFFGARRSVGWNVHLTWPIWARAIPRAIVAGVLAALVGGVVVFLSALITHREQVIALTVQLNPGWVGGIILALIQLFYAINVIMWCVSWSFGPGFTMGDGSVVSLMGTNLGLLPAFPLTAALPVGTEAHSLAWLAFPIAAGAVSAIMILRVRPRARFDETALVGGLSAVLSGLAVVGLAALTPGALGIDRLSHMGPFLVPLLIIAPCVMGLAGMMTGLVVGLVRKPKGPTDPRWWSRWGTTEPEETHKPVKRLVKITPVEGEQLPLDFHPD